MNTNADRDTLSLHSYLAVLRRRKWIVVLTGLLIPMVVLAWSLSQTPTYEASAKVLLSNENLASALARLGNQTPFVENETIVETQADVARVPNIIDRVIRKSGLTEAEVLATETTVTADARSQILTFSTQSQDPELATLVVNEYAQQYVAYKAKLDTASIRDAREAVGARLSQLNAADKADDALYGSLLRREEELRALEILQTANARRIQTAAAAPQISPQPVRNTIVGLVLGAVLGLGLAFLFENLDTRIRSADELGDELGLPVLGKIPVHGKASQEADVPISMNDPMGVDAEAFRMLRTNLEFAITDRDLRSILITSAVMQEGKSTVSANLGLAFARAGRRVVLVDLDLRRPRLHSLFNLAGTRGLSAVLRGELDTQDAMVRVPLLPSHFNGAPRAAGSPQRFQERLRRTVEVGPQPQALAPAKLDVHDQTGELAVLPAGPVPPDPGEIVTSRSLSRVLEYLRDSYDLVLIDSPPALQVGDAAALSAQADAVVVVTRLSQLRRGAVSDLHRALNAMGGEKLGFVVNADQARSNAYYGYYSYSSTEPVKEEVV